MTSVHDLPLASALVSLDDVKTNTNPVLKLVLVSVVLLFNYWGVCVCVCKILLREKFQTQNRTPHEKAIQTEVPQCFMKANDRERDIPSNQ